MKNVHWSLVSSRVLFSLSLLAIEGSEASSKAIKVDITFSIRNIERPDGDDELLPQTMPEDPQRWIIKIGSRTKAIRQHYLEIGTLTSWTFHLIISLTKAYEKATYCGRGIPNRIPKSQSL
ncbi:unnamed protein product [Dovyalis caffra]|uniref:Uncharacterized protein n=1 Tax=Dovyalis caffra TaxID=77055 RepID=A0AAV1RTV6_9ROSI|nr:unnamed protein product [Dovyalis caffra]